MLTWIMDSLLLKLLFANQEHINYETGTDSGFHVKMEAGQAVSHKLYQLLRALIGQK